MLKSSIKNTFGLYYHVLISLTTILFPSTLITLIFALLWINTPSATTSNLLPYILAEPEGLKGVRVIPSLSIRCSRLSAGPPKFLADCYPPNAGNNLFRTLLGSNPITRVPRPCPWVNGGSGRRPKMGVVSLCPANLNPSSKGAGVVYPAGLTHGGLSRTFGGAYWIRLELASNIHR
jgi:hypothetical protein